MLSFSIFPLLVLFTRSIFVVMQTEMPMKVHLQMQIENSNLPI